MVFGKYSVCRESKTKIIFIICYINEFRYIIINLRIKLNKKKMSNFFYLYPNQIKLVLQFKSLRSLSMLYIPVKMFENNQNLKIRSHLKTYAIIPKDQTAGSDN